jgi:hypothetical protein
LNSHIFTWNCRAGSWGADRSWALWTWRDRWDRRTGGRAIGWGTCGNFWKGWTRGWTVDWAWTRLWWERRRTHNRRRLRARWTNGRWLYRTLDRRTWLRLRLGLRIRWIRDKWAGHGTCRVCRICRTYWTSYSRIRWHSWTPIRTAWTDNLGGLRLRTKNGSRAR